MSVSLPFSTSLDKSAEQIVAVLKNFISVATKDDVQVSAILAAERFGASLAVSPDSRRKVERLVDKQSDSIFLGFLKSSVGYAAGGSLKLLRQSLAGINFLTVAAALLGSTDNFDVASAFETMMQDVLPRDNSAMPLPTAYQLDRLIQVLEPTLVKIKFQEDVISWKNWFVRCAALPPAMRQHAHENRNYIPNADGIRHVVDALRRVSRVGDAETAQITVTAFAAWVAAFTVWSLGIPPKILLSDGTILLSESSPVTLVYVHEIKDLCNIEVKVFRSQDSFADILTSVINTPDTRQTVGMVSLRVHAEESLQRLGFERGEGKTESLGYRAMREALPGALYQVRDLCWQNTDLSHVNLSDCINPFPSPKRIASIAKQYLGLEELSQLQQPCPGWCVADMPLVRSWAAQQQWHAFDLGSGETFVPKLSSLVADILALSLFDGSLDGIMLWSGPIFRSGPGDFLDGIKEILVTGKPKRLSMNSILHWALELVRHDVTDKLQNECWLGSSFKGQVVFPKIYDRYTVSRDGFLELYVIPGILMSNENKKIHRHVVTGRCQMTQNIDDLDKRPVTRVENLFDTKTIVWRVEDMVDGIGVAMGWSGGADLLDTFQALKGIGESIGIRSCAHSTHGTSPNNESDAYFQGPVSDFFRDSEQRKKIAVIPVAGNEQLRLLAMSSLRPSVTGRNDTGPLALVNQGACIACALARCRQLGCFSLIL